MREFLPPCPATLSTALCTRSRGSAPSRRLRLLPFHSPLDGYLKKHSFSAPHFRCGGVQAQLSSLRRTWSTTLYGLIQLHGAHAITLVGSLQEHFRSAHL